jgi:hypothetical protein
MVGKDPQIKASENPCLSYRGSERGLLRMWLAIVSTVAEHFHSYRPASKSLTKSETNTDRKGKKED